MSDELPRVIPAHRMGSLYPTGSIIAHLADADRAAAAEGALREAGWADDEVSTASGEQVIRVEQAARDGRSLLQRIVGAFPSEETQIENEFKEAAARGAWAIMAKAETDERRDRARDILRAHGASGLRHYGKRVITDL